MRFHDRLMIETPRPYAADKPFTGYADLYEGAVVIDATQAAEVFLATAFADYANEEPDLPTNVWQAKHFVDLDWRQVIGNIAPPFSRFVIEMDFADASLNFARTLGLPGFTARDTMEMGKVAVAFRAVTYDEWDAIDSTDVGEWIGLPTSLREQFADVPDVKWVYCVSTFFAYPGEPLRGPSVIWMIPVTSEGLLCTKASRMAEENWRLPTMIWRTPECTPAAVPKTRITALASGWTGLLPAMMALTFMHTPKGPKGYHDLFDGEEPNKRLARKHLERNFVPLTRYKVLDITNLRTALRESNGGTEPTSLEGIIKALHVVRGNYATYMPNTYFGRKHDEPITVFRPSHRRGDVKAGVIDKDYALATTTEETP